MDKIVYRPEATTATLFAVVGNPWALLGCYLLVINLITFFIFGLDKWKAKYKETHEKTRRVPEKTLFLLAALGGGAFAYIKFIKPKQGAKVSADPDDYEFEDEEYENEDVPEQEEQEDQN